MRLFQAAVDTCLDSPFFASLSVHGLHFTVYAPSKKGSIQTLTTLRTLGCPNLCSTDPLDKRHPRNLFPWSIFSSFSTHFQRSKLGSQIENACNPLLLNISGNGVLGIIDWITPKQPTCVGSGLCLSKHGRQSKSYIQTVVNAIFPLVGAT